MSRVAGPILPSTPPSPPASPPLSPVRSSPTSPGVPTKPSLSQLNYNLLSRTITILDWDDTLLPSTFLTTLGYRLDFQGPLPEQLTTHLEELSNIVIQLLRDSLRIGKLMIITNAEEGWVQLSAYRFLPRVFTFLIRHNIKITSARTEFENEFKLPVLWKTAAFSREIALTFPKTKFKSSRGVNVISIGDSVCERLAATTFGECRGGCWVKTIKLMETCCPEAISKMLSLVRKSWQGLSTYKGSFDVNLTI